MLKANEIAQAIAENRDVIEPNLDKFWMRMMGDLVAADIPRAKVAATMFRAAMTMLVAEVGPNESVRLVREFVRDVETAGENSRGGKKAH